MASAKQLAIQASFSSALRAGLTRSAARSQAVLSACETPATAGGISTASAREVTHAPIVRDFRLILLPFKLLFANYNAVQGGEIQLLQKRDHVLDVAVLSKNLRS